MMGAGTAGRPVREAVLRSLRNGTDDYTKGGGTGVNGAAAASGLRRDQTFLFEQLVNAARLHQRHQRRRQRPAGQ